MLAIDQLLLHKRIAVKKVKELVVKKCRCERIGCSKSSDVKELLVEKFDCERIVVEKCR